MQSQLMQLTAIARSLQAPLALEELLQVIVDGSATLIGCERVSLRLVDPSRTKVMAVCRAGEPAHSIPAKFALGEGLVGWIAQHGEPILTGNAQADDRFVTRPGMIITLQSFLGVPLTSGAVTMGVLAAVSDEPDAFNADDGILLTLVAAMCSPHVEIARLARLSRIDPLTGSLNRRGLNRSFPEVATDSESTVRPLSVAMADIDHFKWVNDEHGHAVGDQVLKHVTDLLSGVLRAGDAVVRYGGEEFLLILPRVALGTAERIAERARTAVESAVIPAGDGQVRVSISLGVAERRPGEDRDEVIARADAAMYEAKQSGRNCVRVAR